MVPELKNYVDLAKPNSRTEFEGQMVQWVRSQPFKKSMYRTTGGYKYSSQTSDSQKYNNSGASSESGSSFTKSLTCFACGKVLESVDPNHWILKNRPVQAFLHQK